MLGYAYRTVVPIGLFGVFIVVLTMNMLWLTGASVGYTAVVNDSVSVSESDRDLDLIEENVTRVVVENTTAAEQRSFQAAYGISVSDFVGYMTLSVRNGLWFGYYNPGLTSVLVRYQVPIVLPIVSLVLIKYRWVNKLIKFVFRGN